MKKDPWDLPKVEVEWLDSASWGSWRVRERIDQIKPLLCKSVGYLYKKDDEQLHLLQSVSPEADNASDGINIPRSCVKRIKRLR